MLPRPKKSLGQNFLTSRAVIAKMVSAGEVNDKDIVVEIGPGRGALTRALLGRAQKVIAIEKDSQLIEVLRESFPDEIKTNKLELVPDDALEADIERLVHGQPYKLIANIPYYITGALLRTYLSMSHSPTQLVFLMQKEVAERIVKRDGKESILSLSVQAYGTPKYVQKVSPKSFTPSPAIDSAILEVRNISKAAFKQLEQEHGSIAMHEWEEKFFELVKTGFAHKRKTLMKNLSGLFSREQLEIAIRGCNLRDDVRAEDVSFQHWICMLKHLNEVY
jgi:16S rRNA (adenine1518-N6/adenine1519-N6)-dimethyltransferase